MNEPLFSCAPRKLSPPWLPQINKQGIGASAAKDLRVYIDPYPDMDEGDLIELFWNDCYVASALLSAADINQTLVLRVPQSFLLSGKSRVWYRVMKIGAEPVTSPVCKLWVKLEPPGGHLINAGGDENQGLAPLSIPFSVLREGLSAEQIRCGVEVCIKPYMNMDSYDEITLRWGDVRMDLPALGCEDVGQSIIFRVPAALIEEAGDDLHHEVTYCVIDRVGNNSHWAPSRAVSVCLDMRKLA
jgi:hypothetical protein